MAGIAKFLKIAKDSKLQSDAIKHPFDVESQLLVLGDDNNKKNTSNIDNINLTNTIRDKRIQSLQHVAIPQSTLRIWMSQEIKCHAKESSSSNDNNNNNKETRSKRILFLNHVAQQLIGSSLGVDVDSLIMELVATYGDNDNDNKQQQQNQNEDDDVEITDAAAHQEKRKILAASGIALEEAFSNALRRHNKNFLENHKIFQLWRDLLEDEKSTEENAEDVETVIRRSYKLQFRSDGEDYPTVALNEVMQKYSEWELVEEMKPQILAKISPLYLLGDGDDNNISSQKNKTGGEASQKAKQKLEQFQLFNTQRSRCEVAICDVSTKNTKNDICKQLETVYNEYIELEQQQQQQRNVSHDDQNERVMFLHLRRILDFESRIDEMLSAKNSDDDDDVSSSFFSSSSSSSSSASDQIAKMCETVCNYLIHFVSLNIRQLSQQFGEGQQQQQQYSSSTTAASSSSSSNFVEKIFASSSNCDKSDSSSSINFVSWIMKHFELISYFYCKNESEKAKRRDDHSNSNNNQQNSATASAEEKKNPVQHKFYLVDNFAFQLLEVCTKYLYITHMISATRTLKNKSISFSSSSSCSSLLVDDDISEEKKSTNTNSLKLFSCSWIKRVDEKIKFATTTTTTTTEENKNSKFLLADKIISLRMRTVELLMFIFRSSHRVCDTSDDNNSKMKSLQQQVFSSYLTKLVQECDETLTFETEQNQNQKDSQQSSSSRNRNRKFIPIYLQHVQWLRQQKEILLLSLFQQQQQENSASSSSSSSSSFNYTQVRDKLRDFEKKIKRIQLVYETQHQQRQEDSTQKLLLSQHNLQEFLSISSIEFDKLLLLSLSSSSSSSASTNISENNLREFLKMIIKLFFKVFNEFEKVKNDVIHSCSSSSYISNNQTTTTGDSASASSSNDTTRRRGREGEEQQQEGGEEENQNSNENNSKQFKLFLQHTPEDTTETEIKHLIALCGYNPLGVKFVRSGKRKTKTVSIVFRASSSSSSNNDDDSIIIEKLREVLTSRYEGSCVVLTLEEN